MRQYLSLLEYVYENGEGHCDRTGVGTLSVFGEQLRIDVSEKFPLLTTKRVSPRWVFEELRWFLMGSSDERELAAQGVNIWEEWATPEKCEKFGRPPGMLGPIYGPMLRRFPCGYSVDDVSDHSRVVPGHVDQLGKVVSEIEHNPTSRRLVVSYWHPYWSSFVELPPCHTLWQIKMHTDGSLSMHLYCRSIDVFLGLPYNIASYSFLLYMLAKVNYSKPKELIISFGDLHLYRNHIEQARTQLRRSATELPTVEINAPMQSPSRLKNLLDIRWEHIEIEGYNPQPSIYAPVAV